MKQRLKRVSLTDVLGASAIVIALLILMSDDDVLVGIDLFELLLFVMVLFVVFTRQRKS